VIGFAKALPVIRRTTSDHLRRQGLPREKVLATVVQLLEKTLIRVGNDEYARSNRSYGLTTMRDGHVEVKGPRLRFSFRGKSGVEHEIDLTDRRLAKIVRQCRDLPGYELFQYVDENGARQTVGSEEVNAYLKDITGQDLTSKDFRTWAGTVLAAQLLRELEAFTSNAQARRNILAVVDMVAKRLGNTKAVCRKCYIHPAIFDAYLDGSMLEAIEQRARKVSRAVDRLTSGEAAVLRLLKRRTAATSKHRNGN
jgi:DNA topoisomerase-1